MLSAFCIAAPTRPLPRLFPAVCASTPRSPVGSALALFNDCAGGDSSRYIFGETVGWYGGRSSDCLIDHLHRHSITPRLTFVKRGCLANQCHKRGATHCCVTVFILPPSRRGSRSACRWTCYVVRLGSIALHVRWYEIVHPVASTGRAGYHMVCCERQRMRRVTTPVEGRAAIVAGRSRSFGAVTQDGAVAVVEPRILTHFRQSPP